MGWNVAFQIGASQPSISYQEEELMNTESCIPSSYEIFYDFFGFDWILWVDYYSSLWR